jgi:hypothetical protein
MRLYFSLDVDALMGGYWSCRPVEIHVRDDAMIFICLPAGAMGGLCFCLDGWGGRGGIFFFLILFNLIY